MRRTVGLGAVALFASIACSVGEIGNPAGAGGASTSGSMMSSPSVGPGAGPGAGPGPGATTGAGPGATSGSTSGPSSGASASAGATAGASTSAAASTSAGAGGGGNPGGGLFEAPEPWSTAVDADPPDPSSNAIITWLANNGGWGAGSFRIDYSITLQYADANTPFKPFVPSGDFYSPDCDNVPFPVPNGGAIEGESGYACNSDGDCHLLVVDTVGKKLYEMWRAFAPPAQQFNGGCGAVWDLTKAYPPNLRGDGCTSADAGGFPISAMLFTADEVAAGNVPHAIRFILPNARIRGGGVYVHPGTHTTGSTSGGANAPPYGVRLRLKASTDLTNLGAGAQVVARGLQKYGMFLSDGGNIALTAADDRFTAAKWTDANVNMDSFALSALQVTDFEVVNLGAIIPANDCVRNP